MSDFCELVPSQRGHSKLSYKGYLYFKDKNRNDPFYWICEEKKSGCKGRATTILLDGEHRERTTSDHNHAPDASRSIVSSRLAKIRDCAKATKEKPIQIIQKSLVEMDHIAAQSMPSREALRQRIKRVRREGVVAEPKSIMDLEIPDELKNTFDGQSFLINESVVGENKILLFTTVPDVRRLSKAKFWIMDGTFKTVPNIFMQLYSIHAPVGPRENSSILPLVYALMTSKCVACYSRLLQVLSDFASNHGITLNPQCIISDFEMAVINATKEEFPNADHRCCFFHLGQSVWRKVQECGLSSRYGEDNEFSLSVRHIPALAFLTPEEIPTAFGIVKDLLIDENTEELLKWFEENYVLGRIRRVGRNGVVRSKPLFSPSIWSVFGDAEIPRTQNNVEAWHRRWETLCGASHIGVFHMIREFQKEQRTVTLRSDAILAGEPRSKKKRLDERRAKRIQTVINGRPNMNVLEFLRAISYNLSL